jgi:excisionase family DNA binding protein
MKPAPMTNTGSADQPAKIAPRLLRIEEVAEYLSVSVETVKRLNAALKMPAPIRLCRYLLWDANELAAWIDQARKNGGKPPARKEWTALYDVLLKSSRN